MSAPITTRTVRTLDIPLGPGRTTLRLVLSDATAELPAELMLAWGFGTGSEFSRPLWAGLPIQVPASIVPELIGALGALSFPAST